MLLAFRLGLRDLRGQVRQFWVFVLCLLLGVASIAAVGSVTRDMLAALDSEAQPLLGGDLEFTTVHRQATDDEHALLTQFGNLSKVAELRTMARTTIHTDTGSRPKQRLVELKAVDAAYPLYGTVELNNGGDVQAALSNGQAVVDPVLLSQLELAAGDSLQIGSASFIVADSISYEPDRTVSGFNIGPRVMISAQMLEQTGLIQPGSLVDFAYRLKLNEPDRLEANLAAIKAATESSDWRVRTALDAAPSLRQFVDRLGLFLTLVGLTALLIGGVGVANGVSSYLGRKTATLATFKSLGATQAVIRRIYLFQVGLVAVGATAAGLLLGSLVPFVAVPILTDSTNLRAVPGLHLDALGLAAVFGLAIALAFTLWPIAKAGTVSPAQLFRATQAPNNSRPGWRTLLVIAVLVITLACLAVFTAVNQMVAGWFLVGAAIAMVLFFVLGLAIQRAAGWLPRTQRPAWQLALSNIHRPGSPTPSIVLSLGLGLTLLVTIAQTQGNLQRQINENLPSSIPAFFVLDIAGRDAAAFEQTTATLPEITKVERVPMLRGRFASFKGKPIADWDIPEEIDWMFEDDSTRGVTYAASAPTGTDLVEGEWWPSDYKGAQLVSLDSELRDYLGLAIGDKLTVTLLGREFEATIANFRRIDWRSMQINFVMVFSPGLLSKAPQMQLATLEVAAPDELAVETRLLDQFPNITMIRVRLVLERVQALLANLALSISLVASVTLITGVIVLAGALSAGRERRIYDTVVLKVLGATRGLTFRAFLIEYGLTGFITALIASALGSVAAYLLIAQVLDLPFLILPSVVLITTLLAMAMTVGFGFLGTWMALNAKAMPLLRNE